MSKTTLAPKTRNITMLFRQATAAEIEEGAQWYRDAYEIAGALAVKNGTTVEVAAGIIAALSPLQSWGANVNLAARFMAAGGLSEGYLKNGLAKANQILKGAQVLNVLSGLKVRNFYLGIASQGTLGVCLDRHSWSVACGYRFGNFMPTLTPKRYAAGVEAYTRAARILSKEYGEEFTPAQVQAVTWKLYRRMYWSDGAFDSFTI
jgi:hypothetical protein